MIERCRRLCGGLDACFINSNKYIECISDILINKAFGTTEILEQLIRECNDKKLSAFLREALRGPYELINWIKYLQIARDLKLTSQTVKDPGEERRKEMRYPLPRTLQRYISLIIDADGKMLEGIITNMSQGGIQFITPEPLKSGTLYNIKISSTRAAKRELFLKIKLIYCQKGNNNFISGAQVLEMADELSFNFFKNVIDLIQTI